MEKNYLTATDIMKFVYCPRIIYYIYVLKQPQSVTKKEEEGIKKETVFIKKGRRTKLIKELPALPKIFRVNLSSEKFNFRTILDSIILNKDLNEAYPLQAKNTYTPRKLFETQKMQLLFEAILIEDCLNFKSPFGFIKFLKSNEIQKVTLSEKSKVFSLAKEIREIISKENFPLPTKYKNRCVDCCYRHNCWGD